MASTSVTLTDRPRFVPPCAPAYVPVVLPLLLDVPDADLTARQADLARRLRDGAARGEAAAAMRLELTLVQALREDRRARGR